MTLSERLGVTVLRDVRDLRTQVAAWRKRGETIALVPTMGALHAGHISLVEVARRQASRVIMSIFVNPTQFAPTEDLSTYPRSFEADIAKFEAVGGDAVFAPETDDMYPAGFATSVTVSGPAAVGLEDRFRPTHFAGVATVVAKLLNQCRPEVAVFGEKDFQQLKVITRMAMDLDLGPAIHGAPIVREADGLALSSRNVYLSPEERTRAPALYQALLTSAQMIAKGTELGEAMAMANRAIGAAGFVIDYVEARHADSLAPIARGDEGPIRILAAARLGRTRLIDNVAVERS